MQVFAGHTGPVQCGEFTPDGIVLVVLFRPKLNFEYREANRDG
jgi:hypothetical protein